MNQELAELPANRPVLLLSAGYNPAVRLAYLKFYDPESNKMYGWYDQTGHKPYCYTKPEFLPTTERAIRNNGNNFRMEKVTKRDVLEDRDVELIKVIADKPTDIRGENGINNATITWEAGIKYHERYLFDNQLIVGAYYIRKGLKIEKYEYKIDKDVEEALQKLVMDKLKGEGEQYLEYIDMWAKLLNQPVPDMKRIAIDIEVDAEDGRLPSAVLHDKQVTAIGLVGSDGFKKVMVLNKEDKDEQTDFVDGAELYDTEYEMFEDLFKILAKYPIILTFNGDDFDLPYLFMRAQDPDIAPDGSRFEIDQIPFLMGRDFLSKKGMQAEPVGYEHGVHIDLFRFFSNKSIQIYAFNKKYSSFGLDAISEALLGANKTDLEGDTISELSMQRLAQYCLNDADLTQQLTTFNSSITMKLLVIICRVGRLPIEDVSRYGVNQWLRGIMYFEHIRTNALIPRREELDVKGKASTTAIIDDKKYKGGFVAEPKPGVHFNVVVCDFASLYPSIIKVHNLSHETVNCSHKGCRNDPACQIEGTAHWICKKYKGMTSLLIGALRDLRVNYYKKLGKDKSIKAEIASVFQVVEQTIKVVLNASYGVLGFETFPIFCLPVADSTTALGRAKIGKAMDKAKEMSVETLYGDTDSMFLENPNKAVTDELIRWAHDELGVDLEVDKHYRYVVFSDLKKNYVGVHTDGKVDIKGLTGKKSGTPPFIRKAFADTIQILSQVYSASDFATAKDRIKKVISETVENMETDKIPLAEMTYNIIAKKDPKAYGKREEISVTTISGETATLEKAKGVPQHIKAADLLKAVGKEVKVGDVISFIKCRSGPKPLQLVKYSDVDKEKYREAMGSTFDQLLPTLDMDFESAAGKEKQQTLDTLFWGN